VFCQRNNVEMPGSNAGKVRLSLEINNEPVILISGITNAIFYCDYDHSFNHSADISKCNYSASPSYDNIAPDNMKFQA